MKPQVFLSLGCMQKYKGKPKVHLVMKASAGSNAYVAEAVKLRQQKVIYQNRSHWSDDVCNEK